MTLEELKARQYYIGSSDVPAILGVDKYRTMYDIWLEKTGQLEPKVNTNLPSECGTYLEPALCQWCADSLATPWEKGHVFFHPNGVFRSQLDGYMPAIKASIESKTSGLFNPRFDDSDYGAQDTNQIPFNFLAQVQFSLLCSGLDRAYVVCLIGAGRGLLRYIVEKDEALQTKIKTICERFWNEHVLTNTPPEGQPTFAIVQNLKRTTDKIIPIDDEWIEQYVSLRNQKALVDGAMENFKRDLLLEMKDAEIAASPVGTLEYLENSRGIRSVRLRGYKGE
jgi:putative phage-type endonuclease